MENQEQNPPQQEQPFVAAKQVGFNLEDIILNTNNEKTIHQISNMYKEYLVEFWYSAKTLENFKVFFSTPTGGIYGEVGVNTFRNAHYLPHFSEEVVPAKGTLKKTLLHPRWRLLMEQIIQCLGGKTGGFDQITNKDAIILYSLANRINIDYALKPNQPEEPPFTTHMLVISSTDKPLAFKAPKPSSNVKRVPQGIKPRAKPRHKKHSTSLKQPSVSSKEATKISTPMDTRMHKEDQQATSDPTSLGVTSEARANSQLSSGNDASTASTAEADLENFAPKASSVARQIKEETSSTIKLEDLANLVSHVQPSFKDLDSRKDDPVIVVADSDEDEDDEVHATKNVETEDTSVPKSSSPIAAGKVLKTKFSNILSVHDFSSSLPTKLKDLPFKFDELTEEVKRLKKQVHELEIKIPGDLKEIPTKMEDFTKTVTRLTSQVTELKTLQWELPIEFLSLPVQVALVQAKLKTLDALPGLLLNVTKALNKFAQREHIKEDKGKKALSLEEAEKESSNSDSDDETHVTGSIKLEDDAKAEAAKQEGEVKKAELVDLLGPKVVKKYYNDKLQYDNYCDKMLNRIAVSRITNCDVLTRKGPITLKVYREDGTSEIIPNFKASDMHLSEWREDPLNKLNDLAKQKRKHADGIHDYFKANKRLKQDFVTIEDLKDFSNTMLHTVQEIFFRRHQGPGLDDYARTFSSLLLAEVDKRNLNPLKQMRVIEQLRHVCSGTETEEGLLKLKRVVSLLEGYRVGKRLLYVKRNKAISLGNVTFKVGLEVGWIRRIQVLDTAYWGFLGVGTTLDIFQNIILIQYLEYGVLSLSGYGVLSFILLWSLVSAGTDTPYLP
ncbi:hypothetical protein Tco_1091648 [Tanacetum coccineum]|uniref:Uncharacterized protein n=1 Tax=Tanacetum coccineum TaxID=301880 RepID=A0ABQ5I7T4_9ASTR